MRRWPKKSSDKLLSEKGRLCVPSAETYHQIMTAPTMLRSVFTLISPPSQPNLGADRHGALGGEEGGGMR